MRNARLDEVQAGIKTGGRNINNLRYGDHTTLMAESEEGLKSFWMKVKEESEKASLKLKSQKSGPIISWQIDGETVETVIDFILGAPESLQMVTAAMKLKDTYLSGATLGITDEMEAWPPAPTPHSAGTDPGLRS